LESFSKQKFLLPEAQMALNRKVGFFTGLGYKGGGPMWAWLLHRTSGLAMVLFVGLHIIAGFVTQQFGSEAGIAINTIYENWIFQLVLFFLVIFHAVNGLRVVILDLWPALLEYQREVIWLQWLIFIPLYTLVLFVIIKDALGL
jgi:succinate dehydrogenase / fumarate reductase cytochrome b subunit